MTNDERIPTDEIRNAVALGGFMMGIRISSLGFHSSFVIRHSSFLLACALLAGAHLPAAQPSKPNLLFLLPDQWRAQAFGFAGDPNVKTPQLDRLEKESVNFINAVAGLPVCCPTRASLLTGRCPLTTGVFLNDV